MKQSRLNACIYSDLLSPEALLNDFFFFKVYILYIKVFGIESMTDKMLASGENEKQVAEW